MTGSGSAANAAAPTTSSGTATGVGATSGTAIDSGGGGGGTRRSVTEKKATTTAHAAPQDPVPRVVQQGPREAIVDVTRGAAPRWSLGRRPVAVQDGSRSHAGGLGPGSYGSGLPPLGGGSRSTCFSRGADRFHIPGHRSEPHLGPGRYGIVKTVNEVFQKRKYKLFGSATREQAGKASGSVERNLGIASPGPIYFPSRDTILTNPSGPTARFGLGAPRSQMATIRGAGYIGPGDYEERPKFGRDGESRMTGLGYGSRAQASTATGVLESLKGLDSPGPGRYEPKFNKDGRYKSGQKWSMNSRETMESYDRHCQFWKGLEPSPVDAIFTAFQKGGVTTKQRGKGRGIS